MGKLTKLQKNFSKALFATNDDALIALQLTNPQHFKIYQQSIIHNHTLALQTTYPTIVNLVGLGFFNTAARFYMQQCPATQGNFNLYGEAFIEFIANYTPAKDLVYLKEVAQFDWAYHIAHYALGFPLLQFAELAHILGQEYDSLTLHLHPACQLFNFKYPVLDIWNMCHQNIECEINLNFGMKIAIFRNRYNVTAIQLSDEEYIFLSAIKNRQSFIDICATLLSFNQNSDIAEILKKWIKNNCIIGYDV